MSKESAEASNLQKTINTLKLKIEMMKMPLNTPVKGLPHLEADHTLPHNPNPESSPLTLTLTLNLAP